MRTVTPQESLKLLNENNAVLVDVRESYERKSEYIEQSIHIPLNELNTDSILHKNVPIILYCKSGTRSAQACSKLNSENNSAEIYSMEKGIEGWKNAGLQTTKTTETIPLDRQVQITTGLITFFGTMLGLCFSTTFFILPGFIGAGLVFAGLSGSCGMARILSKMPWNANE